MYIIQTLVSAVFFSCIAILSSLDQQISTYGLEAASILLPFCSHSANYAFVTRLNLKYRRAHTKSFISLDPWICKAASPFILCNDSFIYLSRTFRQYQPANGENWHLPVHLLSLLCPPPPLWHGLPQKVRKGPTLLDFHKLWKWIYQGSFSRQIICSTIQHKFTVTWINYFWWGSFSLLNGVKTPFLLLQLLG